MKCFKPAALLQSTSGLLPQRGGLLLFPHTNKNQFTARLGLDCAVRAVAICMLASAAPTVLGPGAMQILLLQSTGCMPCSLSLSRGALSMFQWHMLPLQHVPVNCRIDGKPPLTPPCR